jgi:hypothetical protein
VDVNFTHSDLALLVLDILALRRAEDPVATFELLESHDIEPVGGWAKSDPERLVTPREMEEVRCSISLASDEGSISVGPSLVTTSINRFCEELEVSLRATGDSGVAKGDRPSLSAETGYQGATGGGDGTQGGVASTPF